VSEIIKESNIDGFFEQICKETHKHMIKHSEEKVSLEVILFDFDGNILAKKS
jgi:cobalt-precorrin-5B (C1)-methyltransferase